ncbi:MAG: 16S rRNA (uracil(1498)-N(3))-methyltransferase [Vicingus serpentipes]|nr:16S rRNA (uracil(1498)-N(3))-methyltransferase [Vicingus serpentipes]
MHLFYQPNINKDTFQFLDEIESKHAIRVLRLKENDLILLVDGKGTFYEAKITNAHPKKCGFEIQQKRIEESKLPYLHIAIAPTKNNERTEWFIEKCTEIGIHEITPILTQHSERKNLKEERLVKTAVSAMKQSLKATLPQINPVTPLKNIVITPFDGKKYIAHCHEGNKKLLKTDYPIGENALVLIGPEGDFSGEEVELAKKNGFIPISLGKSRLRTETAGIVACHTINLLNE